MSTKAKPVHPKLKSKPNDDGTPRYKPGTHPIYDQEYQLRFKNSWILNDAARKRDLKNAGRLHDVYQCEVTLRELTGAGEQNRGFYKDGKSWYRARIPGAEEQLKQLFAEHKRWAQQQIRQAKYLELPKHWPKDLLQKRLKAEACLDVYMAERQKVLDTIEKIKTRLHQKPEEPKMLEQGPITVQFNEKEELIDGQQWDVLSAEYPVPFICDERSPYFKMPIVNYVEMAKEWLAHVKKLGEAEAEKLIQKMEKEFEDGKRKVPIASMQKGSLRRKHWKTLTFELDELPDWPKGVKPVDELKKQAE
jgi:hypothetical protein